MQCPEYLPFETPVGRTLIQYQLNSPQCSQTLDVSLLLWRLEVMCVVINLISFLSTFKKYLRRRNQKYSWTFGPLMWTWATSLLNQIVPIFFHVLFLTPFALPMPNLEITELPEPLDGMLKIITIRNNMFLFINSILMESAYFVLQGREKKNCLPPFLFHLPGVHRFFRWYKVHGSYCFFS